MEKQTITPSELYGHFGEILGKVRYGGESFTIGKRGRFMAKIVSADKVASDKNGIRRYPRPEYVQVTPGEFRSRMSERLAQVRFGNQKVLITYRGEVVAIVRPMEE